MEHKSSFFDTLAHGKQLGLQNHEIALVLLLHLLGVVFESVSLGILLPVFQFIQEDGNLGVLTKDNALWQTGVDAYRLIGLEVTLSVLLATSFIAILGRQIFVFIRLVFTARIKHSLMSRIRSQLFRKFFGTTLDYQEGEELGGIVNDFTTAASNSINAIFAMLAFLGTLMVFVVYSILLVGISPAMTFATLLILGGTAGLLLKVVRKARGTGIQLAGADRRFSSFMVERLKSARLARLSSTESIECQELDRLAEDQRDKYVLRDRQLASVSVLIEPVAAAIGLTFFYFAITDLGMEIEKVGLFLLVVLRLLPMAKEALMKRQSVLAGLGSIERVHGRFSSMDNAQEESGGRQPLPDPIERIVFQGVQFAYPSQPDRPILKGIDLSISASTVTALVGPSGAGKSTLIDLLPKIRSFEEGQISINGLDIGDIDTAELRSTIAYVPQTPHLLAGTIAGHISYGAPDSSDEKIQQAAALAGAASFIEALPGKYSAPIGENGVGLSGGQKQRLDLARALARDASILILDEPTSQLDADAEEAFRAAIERIRKKQSLMIFIIGHRLTTVSMADQIVVLNDGQIVDMGKHDELLKKDGWYAQAYAKQMEQ